MKISFPLSASIIIGALFIFGCNNNANKNKTQTSDSGKTKVVDTIAKKEEKKILPNPTYNDLAKYIAGMPITSSDVIDSSLTNNSVWKDFSSNFSKSWAKLDSTKISKMRDWRSKELKDINSKVVFYPFSGADFLNVYTFFPNAESYIMVGLEPQGTLPRFHKNEKKDTLSSYFFKINTSLHAILNFSFFRTESMSTDFRNKDLNGTIHLILLFMERTGNSIVNIQDVALYDTGNMAEAGQQKNDKGYHGTQIDFVDANNHLKKVYYFSVNLDNNHLEQNKAFVNLIQQNKGVTTYLKSASYLMHKDYFSSIRDLITKNSNYVLEDDSGIPYKYFPETEWTANLYGKYNGAIPLFKNVHQSDLETAYKANAKPLEFGIGYKYKPGESNLMLYKKK